MNEKEFFESIKPLISEYIEYQKQPMPDEWVDNRASSILQVQQREYLSDKERFLLEALDEEKGMEIRKELIKELSQIRIETKHSKQENIYDKAKEFIDSNKEKMNKNIEEKNNQFEEIREKRSKAINEKVKAYKLRKMLLNQVGENSIVYKAADKDVRIKLSKYKELDREFKSKKEELEQAQEELAGFEEIYNEIDFESEAGIQTLFSIAESQEEKDEEIERLKDEDIEVIEPEKIKTKSDYEQQRREKIKVMFKEKESGLEDLLWTKYIESRDRVLDMENIDEAEEIVEGIKDKTLLEIYESAIHVLKGDSKSQLLELMNKIKERTLVEEKPEEKKSEAKKSEVNKSEEKKSEAKKPETKKPEVKKSEAKKSEAKKPETKKPEVNKSEEKKPEVNKSEAKKPGAAILKINALYGAKYDKYNISNIDEKSKRIIISKQDLDIDRIAKRELSEKLNKVVDPISIDTYLLMALYKYDKSYNTNTVDKYIKIITKNVSPSEKRKEMKESGLQIEYNLTNLYKSSLSKEQRKEILEIANISKEKGIATVKKGFRVKARETWDNIKDMLPKKTKFKLFPINRNDSLKDISAKNNNILRMESLMKAGKAVVEKSYKGSLDVGIPQDEQKMNSIKIQEKMAVKDEMGHDIKDEKSI